VQDEILVPRLAGTPAMASYFFGTTDLWDGVTRPTGSAPIANAPDASGGEFQRVMREAAIERALGGT
jgi:hypothetical protein